MVQVRVAIARVLCTKQSTFTHSEACASKHVYLGKRVLHNL